MYDYLIVGSGLFGSVFARELTNIGKKCLVIDKRDHIAGNCYSEKINDIHANKYGGHIFHTNSDKIWNYFDQYANLRQYHHFVRVSNKSKIFSFPINLRMFSKSATDIRNMLRNPALSSSLHSLIMLLNFFTNFFNSTCLFDDNTNEDTFLRILSGLI